jgi:ring-1,2-phenylacetyl-CoA epoxidase subunit PaaA
MIRICKEESFHQRQGYEILYTMAKGTPAQRELAQDAINRWWGPSLAMFGPPDVASTHTEQSMAWGIKRFSNDELRHRFIGMCEQQVEVLGLTLPDLREPDYDELFRVIKGDGPCNRDRMRHRRAAHSDGAWVRDAARAHADKQEQKQKQEAAA